MKGGEEQQVKVTLGFNSLYFTHVSVYQAQNTIKSHSHGLGPLWYRPKFPSTT